MAATGISFDLATETRIKTKKPSLYRVLLLNDDYTPMEFVVFILERFFNRSREQATRIMLHVHQKGVGLCGVYTFEVAETKVAQVLDLARRHEHPLQCVMEKEDRPPASSASCSARSCTCSRGREEVTGANVLVALFSERESHAVYFLQEQDMTRSTR
jgi:ATP-dependent Clp protease adaptor protein ClpS